MLCQPRQTSAARVVGATMPWPRCGLQSSGGPPRNRALIGSAGVAQG